MKCLRLSVIVVFAILFPLLSVTAHAQEKQSKYGIYLTQLGDFNFKAKTFSATFWIFTVTPNKDEKVLSSLELTNSTQATVTNQSEEQIPDRGFWYQQRIRGTFRHD